MAYYVSAERDGKRALAVGPFRRHGNALAHVHRVKQVAQRTCRDVDHFDTAWGTARHRAGHPPGKLNAVYGVTPDEEGWLL